MSSENKSVELDRGRPEHEAGQKMRKRGGLMSGSCTGLDFNRHFSGPAFAMQLRRRPRPARNALRSYRKTGAHTPRRGSGANQLKAA